MVSSEFSRTPEQPETTVARFVTRAWEHPLLTEQTREFRANSLATIRQNLDTHGIPLDRVIAIPVGSFLWATDQDSDIDYLLVYKDLQGEVAEKKEFMRRLKAAEEQPIADMHLIKMLPESGLIRERSHGVASALLVTPDSFLVDEGHLAPAIRLRIMDNFTDRPVSFWDECTGYFDRRFKNWAKADVLDNEQALDWKRGYRYYTLLEKRGLQTRTNQERGAMVWEEAFMKAKDSFVPPGFYTYQNALIHSGGEVRIDSRFVATGIVANQAGQ